MSQSIARRLSVLLLAAAVATSVFVGCTKRIDTSTEDKFYKSWTEVMRSLPESRQREFDDGMSMIWFYSDTDAETYALIDGKTGPEILDLVEEMKAKMPKVDTSSKEAFNASLAAIKTSLPQSRLEVYEEWVRELPSYRADNPRIAALNGLMFHKIVENRDFERGPANP